MAKTSTYPNGTAADSASDRTAMAKQSVEDLLSQFRAFAREKPDVRCCGVSASASYWVGNSNPGKRVLNC